MQTANLITDISLSGFKISYSKSVSAAGSTSVLPTVTQPTCTYTYTSGKTSTSEPKDESGNSPISKSAVITYTAGIAQNGFSVANTATGSMTSTSCGTTVTTARNSSTITATNVTTIDPTTTATAAGQVKKTASATSSDYATQIANTATYGEVVITGDYSQSDDDIPASGGSRASIKAYSASQTVTYTSGASRAGIVSTT